MEPLQPNAHGSEALLGRIVAGYQLERVLGVGGTGAVYLARSVERTPPPAAGMGDSGHSVPQQVAIKLLMPPMQLSMDERAEFHARFRREVQALLQLNHPHILPVQGFGEDPATGYAYMVLPYLDGGTLTDRLASGPMPLAQAAADLAQIADALDYAHGKGVIHRDVKPANVLFDSKGQLFLCDFSIAHIFDPGESGANHPDANQRSARGSQPLTTLTVTGQVLGTPIYMAPEQLLSARVGPEADLYALGVLLYQLVTGAVPFQAETPLGLAMQHVQEPPPPPRLRRGDLPEPAEAAMLRALAKAPQERFASAGAFARAFAAGLRGQWSEGLFPTTISQRRGGSATPPPTVVATPPPTVVATPPPSSYGNNSGPLYAAPYGAPVYPQPYTATPPSYVLPARQRSSTTPAVLTIVALIAVIALALSAQAAGLVHLGGTADNANQGSTGQGQSATGSGEAATQPVVATSPPSSTSYCMSLPGFSGRAGPASTGSAYPDVSFPPASVSYLYQTFNDGNYAFELYNLCTDSSTPDGIRTFYASSFISEGWIQTATYPYGGDPSRGCGDPYCWVKGSSPTRYASLETVGANGSVTVYQLRLGLLP